MVLSPRTPRTPIGIGLSVAKSKKQKGPLKKKVKQNNAMLPRHLYHYLDDPNFAKSSKAQADCNKQRASESNNNHASKKLHALMISDTDTDDEERALEEKLRQIQKLKKTAMKK
ncbi:hypothetical protein DXG01_012473 [Tephrocybe rancida]|nr:hypothetical protein DXG01_012473 [Tephrocybe rancida]